MAAPRQDTVRNRLLALMSPDDFALLAPHLSLLDLPRKFSMAEPDRPIGHAYFMETGVGSVVAISPEGQQVEAGLFGRDGVSPVELLLGSDRTLNSIVVQVPGDGLRMEREPFLAALAQSGTLRALMNRYVQALLAQTSGTALSNAVHSVDERLARWILMCDDRMDGDLPLTHEFISIMLAVRRPSVTTSLHVLEGNGFIRSERGCLIVRNRRALEEFAHDAYGKPETEYRRLIGTMR